MSVPRFANKHGLEVIVTPEAVIRHRRERAQALADCVPEAVIMTYQPQLLAAVEAFEETSALTIGGPAEVVYSLDRTEGRVGVVGRFGIGAPVAAVVLEELIALGARRIISIGVAGSLRADLEVGDTVLCTSAVRDEGVSHHYVEADAAALPDVALTEVLLRCLRATGSRVRTGASWTIDAFFRETTEEARYFAEHGALCVEMEAAALFAVAAHRKVALASAFCISDSLANGVWEPAFGSKQLADSVWKLFTAAVAVLGDRESASPS